MMDAQSAFDSRDPRDTTAFYNALLRRGPIGQVAFGLFRAQKRSSRAKVYYRYKHRSNAYDAKREALRYLNAALSLEGSMRWGWGGDEFATAHRHVLYIDTPRGQVSYHSDQSFGGQPYAGAWDGQKGQSNRRVCEFCDDVLREPIVELGDWMLMPFGKFVGDRAASVDEGHLRWLSTWPGLENWQTLRAFIHARVVMPEREQPAEDWQPHAGEVCPFDA